MSKPFFRSGSLLSGVIALAWSGSARAQEAACELECLRGYTCQVLTHCNDGPVSNPEPCSATPTCVSVPCNTDADCAERMKCYDDPTDDTPSMCLPEWHDECSSDASCGAGFTCAPWIPCLDPAEPDCVPEGESVCYIHTQICAGDADCLPGWTCENNPLNSVWVSGPTGETGCGIVEPALICAPPYARNFGNGAGYLDWQTGVEWTSRKVPVSECPEPRSEYVSHTTVGAGVRQQSAGTSSPDSDPGTPAVQNAAESNGNTVAALPTARESSCSLGGAPSRRSERGSIAFALLSVLGLVGLRAVRARSSRAPRQR